MVSVDGKDLALALGDRDPVEIHLYIDGSVIELFVNKQGAHTKRFYYEGSRERDVRLKWVGDPLSIEGLSVWQLSPVSADRLTT